MAATDPVKTRKKTASPKKKSEKPAGESEKKFGKVSVKISHPTKILWPKEKITKGMLIDYYQQMADYILPYLKGRPESLKRNPNGIQDEGFFHKDAGVDAPDWVKKIALYSDSAKKDIHYILCDNRATLAYLNNLGCIEINPWNSTIDSLDNPDYLIIDLDPSSENSFDQVVETARAFKALLDSADLTAFCKTSGATGLHIYLPMARKFDYSQVRDFAHLLCNQINQQLPVFTSLERNLQKRGNRRIYLDYLQNRKGQTLASAYSLRPRPGATVSAPLHWDEVRKGLSPAQFTIQNIYDRVEKMGDLFKGVLGKGVDLGKALNKFS